ncbi:hypothetical protein RND81_14G228100 [Saponaria officinalis]|uniref:Uncharacterized protein n=1 Tax=Saponaria officinalis TaxID=3572 RepID=A0AAW1GTN8_SAPOF
MASSTAISHNRTFMSPKSISSLQNNFNLSKFIHNLPSLTSNSKFTVLSSSKYIVCSVAKTTPPEVELQYNSNNLSTPGWSEFASKVSGEWDGFGADFTTDGKPIELPENVVPEAYREWEVKVFDWQTQCPTLADPQNPILSYRSIKLLPTVGCEADAATIHTVDSKNIGGEESTKTLAFAYQNTGCYVSVWVVKETEAYKVLELEHCLVDPRDKESRVRVIQILHLEGSEIKLQRIRVFCEQWYGPFRNGDQLGGCAIRDSAFASTAALNASDVTGAWQSVNALATYPSPHNELLQELSGNNTDKIIRDQHDLITLPRHLWCSLKENENGETRAEVGWLLDSDFAISSRCVFSSDCQVKEIAVGNETAAVN